ncbi:MAG: hypothetical protein WCL44_12050 [bacterium]
MANKTLGEIAKDLNRSPVYVRGLQARFGLPAMEGRGYTPAYQAFLRVLVHLRTFSISEETLQRLWHIEKKLLQLLHADSTGSPTWFLDSCGQSSFRKRRLLLTNHDCGVEVSSKVLQLGLNFDNSPPELFAGSEMGEDAMSILDEYMKIYARIGADIKSELSLINTAIKWSQQL